MSYYLGPIHLPHLRIRKWLYGQLESYGSVSTYGRLETYGSVNFHFLIFFGSKCLKLPNSSRKVVKLRSKNFQCIYLKKILKIFYPLIWYVQGFYCAKTFEIPHLMRKSSLEKSKLPRKIQNLPICIWGSWWWLSSIQWAIFKI